MRRHPEFCFGQPRPVKTMCASEPLMMSIIFRSLRQTEVKGGEYTPAMASETRSSSYGSAVLRFGVLPEKLIAFSRSLPQNAT